MKLSHAVWGHPRWEGRGGEVWENVVHWRREWQTTSIFLPWEPHEQFEKEKLDRILKGELPGSVGAQYATGDQGRNNSRKNKGIKPKQKQYLVVNVTSDRSKVQCCKEQYCIGTWNVRFIESRQIGSGQTGDGNSEHRHCRNQWNKTWGIFSQLLQQSTATAPYLRRGVTVKRYPTSKVRETQVRR